ncbi:MAG: isochorismatase family protein, partial [Clostridia bacterium]|nr:isochorismatase family protein [Clostridia bacterium]
MKSTYQLDKEEAILLVIDLQERLMPAMYDRDLLLKQASVLLQVAKIFNLPVVMTEQYPRGLGHTVDS